MARAYRTLGRHDKHLRNARSEAVVKYMDDGIWCCFRLSVTLCSSASQPSAFGAIVRFAVYKFTTHPNTSVSPSKGKLWRCGADI